jgi:hypothetical protein
MRISPIFLFLFSFALIVCESKAEEILATLDNQEVIRCRDLYQDQYLLECDYGNQRALLGMTMFGRRLFIIQDDGQSIVTRDIHEMRNKEDEILFMSSFAGYDPIVAQTVLQDVIVKATEYDSIAELEYALGTNSELVTEVLRRLKLKVENSISDLAQDSMTLNLPNDESIDCRRIGSTSSSDVNVCSFLSCSNNQILYSPNSQFTFHPALFSPHSPHPLQPHSYGRARLHGSERILYQEQIVDHSSYSSFQADDYQSSLEQGQGDFLDFMSSFQNFRPRNFSLEDYLPQNLMESSSPLGGHPSDLSRVHEFESALNECEPHPSLDLFKAQIISFRDQLATAEVTQYVYDMVDILGSSYLASHALPPGGCFHEGVYYDSRAFRQSREYFTQSDPRTTSLAESQMLFNAAQEMDDIAWGYRADGCYARAHLMARRFEEMGYHVDKAWIKGDLEVNFEDGDSVEWNFHVAPVVYIPNDDGGTTPYVIDPSIMNEPVPMEQWMTRMTGEQRHRPRESAFPFPANASVYGRASYVITNSNPYLPDDIDSMSEDQKMEEANDTMQAYRGLTQ